MEPNKNNGPGKNGPENNKPKWNIWVALVVTVAIILLISSLFNMISKSQYTATTYTDFRDAMLAGQLKEVLIQPDRIVYLTKEEAAKPAAAQKAFYTGLPAGGDLLALSNELHAMGVVVDELIIEDNSTIIMILYYVIMFALIFGSMRMLSRRMSGEGMMGGFGKSKAKVYMEKQTGVTFRDVAGQDEAKESLQEIIDFLHNPL